MKKNFQLPSQTVSTHNSNQATNHTVQEQARLRCDRRYSKPHRNTPKPPFKVSLGSCGFKHYAEENPKWKKCNAMITDLGSMKNTEGKP